MTTWQQGTSSGSLPPAAVSPPHGRRPLRRNPLRNPMTLAVVAAVVVSVLGMAQWSLWSRGGGSNGSSLLSRNAAGGDDGRGRAADGGRWNGGRRGGRQREPRPAVDQSGAEEAAEAEAEKRLFGSTTAPNVRPTQSSSSRRRRAVPTAVNHHDSNRRPAISSSTVSSGSAGETLRLATSPSSRSAAASFGLIRPTGGPPPHPPHQPKSGTTIVDGDGDDRVRGAAPRRLTLQPDFRAVDVMLWHRKARSQLSGTDASRSSSWVPTGPGWNTGGGGEAWSGNNNPPASLPRHRGAPHLGAAVPWPAAWYALPPPMDAIMGIAVTDDDAEAAAGRRGWGWGGAPHSPSRRPPPTVTAMPLVVGYNLSMAFSWASTAMITTRLDARVARRVRRGDARRPMRRPMSSLQPHFHASRRLLTTPQLFPGYLLQPPPSTLHGFGMIPRRVSPTMPQVGNCTSHPSREPKRPLLPTSSSSSCAGRGGVAAAEPLFSVAMVLVVRRRGFPLTHIAGAVGLAHGVTRSPLGTPAAARLQAIFVVHDGRLSADDFREGASQLARLVSSSRGTVDRVRGSNATSWQRAPRRQRSDHLLIGPGGLPRCDAPAAASPPPLGCLLWPPAAALGEEKKRTSSSPADGGVDHVDAMDDDDDDGADDDALVLYNVNGSVAVPVRGDAAATMMDADANTPDGEAWETPVATEDLFPDPQRRPAQHRSAGGTDSRRRRTALTFRAAHQLSFSDLLSLGHEAVLAFASFADATFFLSDLVQPTVPRQSPSMLERLAEALRSDPAVPTGGGVALAQCALAWHVDEPTRSNPIHATTSATASAAVDDVAAAVDAPSTRKAAASASDDDGDIGTVVATGATRGEALSTQWRSLSDAAADWVVYDAGYVIVKGYQREYAGSRSPPTRAADTTGSQPLSVLPTASFFKPLMGFSALDGRLRGGGGRRTGEGRPATLIDTRVANAQCFMATREAVRRGGGFRRMCQSCVDEGLHHGAWTVASKAPRAKRRSQVSPVDEMAIVRRRLAVFRNRLLKCEQLLEGLTIQQVQSIGGPMRTAVREAYGVIVESQTLYERIAKLPVLGISGGGDAAGGGGGGGIELSAVSEKEAVARDISEGSRITASMAIVDTINAHTGRLSQALKFMRAWHGDYQEQQNAAGGGGTGKRGGGAQPPDSSFHCEERSTWPMSLWLARPPLSWRTVVVGDALGVLDDPFSLDDGVIHFPSPSADVAEGGNADVALFNNRAWQRCQASVAEARYQAASFVAREALLSSYDRQELDAIALYGGAEASLRQQGGRADDLTASSGAVALPASVLARHATGPWLVEEAAASNHYVDAASLLHFRTRVPLLLRRPGNLDGDENDLKKNDKNTEGLEAVVGGRVSSTPFRFGIQVLHPAPPLKVFWFVICAGCCGFSAEITQYVVELQKRLDVSLLAGPKCFCDGYPVAVMDTIHRLYLPPARYHGALNEEQQLRTTTMMHVATEAASWTQRIADLQAAATSSNGDDNDGKSKRKAASGGEEVSSAKLLRASDMFILPPPEETIPPPIDGHSAERVVAHQTSAFERATHRARSRKAQEYRALDVQDEVILFISHTDPMSFAQAHRDWDGGGLLQQGERQPHFRASLDREVPSHRPDYVIGRTMYEFSRISKGWATESVHKADELWVPAEHVRQVYRQSGVPVERLQIIPEIVDTAFFDRRLYRRLELPPRAAQRRFYAPTTEPNQSSTDAHAAAERKEEEDVRGGGGMASPSPGKGPRRGRKSRRPPTAADSWRNVWCNRPTTTTPTPGHDDDGDGNSGRRFTFLSNFKWEPRKGWDVLLEAYTLAFGAEALLRGGHRRSTLTQGNDTVAPLLTPAGTIRATLQRNKKNEGGGGGDDDDNDAAAEGDTSSAEDNSTAATSTSTHARRAPLLPTTDATTRNQFFRVVLSNISTSSTRRRGSDIDETAEVLDAPLLETEDYRDRADWWVATDEDTVLERYGMSVRELSPERGGSSRETEKERQHGLTRMEVADSLCNEFLPTTTTTGAPSKQQQDTRPGGGPTPPPEVDFYEQQRCRAKRDRWRLAEAQGANGLSPFPHDKLGPFDYTTPPSSSSSSSSSVGPPVATNATPKPPPAAVPPSIPATSLYMLTLGFSIHGPLSDAHATSPLVESLEAWAAATLPDGATLADLPHFCIVTETLSERDMAAFFASVDAFVATTRGEGWGLPIINAMSMSLPTIVSPYGGQRDFVDVRMRTPPSPSSPPRDALALPNETQTGGGGSPASPTPAPVAYVIPLDGVDEIPPDSEYGFEPGKKWGVPSVAATAKWLRYAATHPEEGRIIGRRAREHVVKHFSPPPVTDLVEDRLLEAYDKALLKRETRREARLRGGDRAKGGPPPTTTSAHPGKK